MKTTRLVSHIRDFEFIVTDSEKEALLLESMERMALAWSRRALAREILLNAKRTFEHERQPEVIRQASDIFARITNRRWRGISASLEHSSLSILPASRPLKCLSNSMNRQTLLAAFRSR